MISLWKPQWAPAFAATDGEPRGWRSLLGGLVPPLLLIAAVLGSILSGYATPTRGAALGALGAILLATYKTAPLPGARKAALLAAVSLIMLILVDLTGIDMRFNQDNWTFAERIAVGAALIFAALSIVTIGRSLLPLVRSGQLADVSRSTMHITCMVFVILIGATVFSLIFRGFGGDDLVGHNHNMA